MDSTHDDRSVAARWEGYKARLQNGPRDFLSTGIPSLDEQILIEPSQRQLVTIALPWEPAGETPFVIAQAFAKQGASPLCLYPSWSPYWDGALDVDRRDAIGPVPVDAIVRRAKPNQPVIIDQFSRLYWEDGLGHAAREDIVREAGRKLLALSSKTCGVVVVFLRRRTRDVVRMSSGDLRSNGALEYDADVVVMVDPDVSTGTADLLVVKNRNGLTGYMEGRPWPVLPRTVYRRKT